MSQTEKKIMGFPTTHKIKNPIGCVSVGRARDEQEEEGSLLRFINTLRGYLKQENIFRL